MSNRSPENTTISPVSPDASQTMSEERRATLHVLELAAALGHFGRSVDRLDSVTTLLQEAAGKLAGLTAFRAVSFYLVNEQTFGFEHAWCSEPDLQGVIQQEVTNFIEDRSFAWALGRNKPSTVSSNILGRVLLHPLTSSSGPLGMFVGVPEVEHTGDTDIGHYLLTVTLFSTATMLENFHLYSKLSCANESLEQQVAERTKELTASNKQLQETLDEKKAYRQNLEAVFTSLQDALITVNSDYCILSVNKAAEKFLGYTSADVQGRPLDEVLPHCAESCMQVLSSTLERGQIVRDFRAQCNKQEFVLSLSCSPLIQENGERAGAVLVIRDNTRLASLERQLKERHSFRKIVGGSRKMQELYGLLEALTGVDATVLVTGESGTGKELVADALHHNGARAAGPLVKVNCTALSENLLESELFGHVRGAFTGAVKDKAGRFEAAEGGTIFLDEIGDISLRIQVLLLRFLESKEFERVGDTTTRKADVRIVAATNADLRAKVSDGSFRADLFYRLNVMRVQLAPLRERRDDIPMLVEHFIRSYNTELGTQVSGISEDVMGCLMRHYWEGNVRELKHAIEHACIIARSGVLLLSHFAPEVLMGSSLGDPTATWENGNLPVGPGAIAVTSPYQSSFLPDVGSLPPRKAFHDISAEQITAALTKAGGNKTHAARLLGIGRATLYRKIAELGISL